MGSTQDRVLRQFLTKESEKNSAQTQLLGLLVANSIPFNGDKAAASEWETKVKKIWTKYLGLEYGMEVPEHTEKEIQMQEYYAKRVQKLRPKLSIAKDGRPMVTGLESLAD